MSVLTLRLTSIDTIKTYIPGTLISIIIALAANFLAINYGVPNMLFALLLGMALNFLSDHPTCSIGIAFSSKTLLRIGIALLGIRITVDDIFSLGAIPIMLVISSVILTIIFAVATSRLFGLTNQCGLLAGGSVAICGASAALAISSIMPNDDDNRKMTILTVISVTTLSTIAMVLYPVISTLLGLNNNETSLFLGGTIHDVAQVVGAGYSVSSEVGELSTFIKLLRVTMLIPVVFFMATFIFRPAQNNGPLTGKIKQFIPYFLLGFLFFLGVNSLNILPVDIKSGLSSLSGLLLVVAISALGVKTSLKEITSVGWRPFVLILASTVFLAGFILIAVCLMR